MQPQKPSATTHQLAADIHRNTQAFCWLLWAIKQSMCFFRMPCWKLMKWSNMVLAGSAGGSVGCVHCCTLTLLAFLLATRACGSRSSLV